MFVVARIDTARPEPVVAALREAMRSPSADLPLTGLAPMDERIADTLVVERSVTSALAAFALLAVVLAAVGLVASYVPARRAATVDPLVALRSN